MEKIVSSDFSANAFYFAIVRWKLVEISGKLILHERRLILKKVAPMDKLALSLKIRKSR